MLSDYRPFDFMNCEAFAQRWVNSEPQHEGLMINAFGCLDYYSHYVLSLQHVVFLACESIYSHSVWTDFSLNCFTGGCLVLMQLLQSQYASLLYHHELWCLFVCFAALHRHKIQIKPHSLHYKNWKWKKIDVRHHIWWISFS